MTCSLLDLWRTNESLLEGKSFRQVIQFSGEGSLRDGNDTSAEVRDLLAAVDLARLVGFADECLTASFTDSGFALQDIANQIGVRLGFKVAFGRYRGTRNEVGFDGLWTATDGHVVLIEVKTTDTYRINLDTVATYREKLIELGKITDKSSILVVVGRQDTGDLEAQIRGSKHAWDIRLISIEALFRLAAVKEQLTDWATSTQINQVLRPMEYTRLDQIIELIFQTSRDIEQADQQEPDGTPAPGGDESKPRVNVEPARNAALEKVAEKLGIPLVRKGRALCSTSDGKVNVVCLASKRFDGPGGSGNYWYGFTPAQRGFIGEANGGRVVFVCQDTGRAFMIDRDEFLTWLPEMLTTPPDANEDSEIRHWHIYFNDYGDRVELMPKASEGETRNIVEFLI